MFFNHYGKNVKGACVTWPHGLCIYGSMCSACLLYGLGLFGGLPRTTSVSSVIFTQNDMSRTSKYFISDAHSLLRSDNAVQLRRNRCVKKGRRLQMKKNAAPVMVIHPVSCAPKLTV